MRHRKGNKKLGKATDQRLALLKSLAQSVIKYKKIKTTHIRAKEARKLVEKLITLGKKQTVHARREAGKVIQDKELTRQLFSTLAEQYKDRPGGYTRITKLGCRVGDAAPLSLLELVD